MFSSEIVENKKTLMGIATFLILIFHFGSIHKYYGTYNFVSGFLTYYVGSFGVDMFLFLSGIGIYLSLAKNTVSVYYRNRIKRILPTYLLLCVSFWIVKDLIIEKTSLLMFLEDVSLLSFWTRREDRYWYIALTIILYAVSPLLYKIKKKYTYSLMAIGVVICNAILSILLPETYNMLEIALTRIPMYFLGLECGKGIKEKAEVPKIMYLFCLISLALKICKHLFHFSFASRYIGGLLAITVCLLYCIIIRGLPKKVVHGIRCVFDFLGGISLEMYITHVSLIWLGVNLGIKMIAPLTYLIMVLLSLIISVLSVNITHFLVKKYECLIKNKTREA